MIDYGWYIIKVSICLILFYTLYVTAFKKCTFFIINRIYLVLGLLLSFAIPILKFSMIGGQTNLMFTTIIDTSLFEPEFESFQPQNLLNEENAINYPLILSTIYFLGVSALFLKLLFSITRIVWLKGCSEIFHIDRLKVVRVDSPVAFSFFNTIYLPVDESNPMIIEHEASHIRQLHWFDLILMEIVCVLLWFNPFVALYKRSLKLQHEYLADLSVISNGSPIENYLGCMLKRIQLISSNGLVSHFYCKTIKQRIVMITKNKTSLKYIGVYLLALPLILTLMCAFASSSSQTLPMLKSAITVSVDEYIPSIYPLDIAKIRFVNGYGERLNPFTKKKDFHYGIDFAAPDAEIVKSTAKGVVVETDFDSKKGNFILVKHNDVFSTMYTHLKSVSVKIGEAIEKGQAIGFVGNTGLSTGSHLHYEVYKGGERVDPKDYLRL